MIIERDCSYSDIVPLAQSLRKVDQEEIAAASGMTTRAALLLSFEQAKYCKVFLHEGEHLAIYGLEGSGSTGYPWLLATDSVYAHQRPLLKRCLEVITEMQTYYPLLTNFVDARNKLHQRWLRWCGFTPINIIEEYGHSKVPFIEFVRI